MQEESKKIVLLLGSSRSSTILYNFLSDLFRIDGVIQESGVSKKKLIRRRIKKLGVFTVFGQIVFQGFFSPLIRICARSREKKLLKIYSFSESAIPEGRIVNVSSVNDTDTINLLKTINPTLIIVNGTRIISKNILESVKCPFINIHAGITPQYRGVHGGYWALANKEPQHCGVTIHLVDSGIDTGGILKQIVIKPTKKDNFFTYPLIQLGEALPHLAQIMDAYLNKSEILQPRKDDRKGKLWYHPTFIQYLLNWINKGVK